MRKHLIALGLILSLLVNAQPPDMKARRAVALDQLAQTSDDSIAAGLHNTIARTYVRSDLDSALYHFEQSILLANEADAQLLKLNSMSIKSMAFALYGQFDSAKTNLLKVAEQSTVHQMDSVEHQAYFGLGNVVESMGDLTGSLEYYIKALRYFEKTGAMKSLNRTKANMSYIYMKTGDLNRALQLSRASTAFYQANDHSRQLMNGYSRLAKIHQLIGLHQDSSLYYFQKAVDMAKDFADPLTRAKYQLDLANLLTDQHQYAEAKSLYQETIKYLDTSDSNPGFLLEAISNLMYISAIYGEAAQVSKLQKSIEEILPAVEEVEYLRNYHLKAFKTDSLLNNWIIAIGHYQTYVGLNDSLFNSEKSRQLSELQTQYETEKKDNEISALSQQARIDALKLEQQQYFILGLMLFVVLAAGVVVLYVRQERIKKQQQLNELTQRNLRVQMNPHFIFNSMAAIQHYMQEKGAELAGHYMGMFSTLMRQMLEHSREEFIPLGEEIAALKNYLELQMIRFEGQFEYQIIVDEELDEQYTGVPPMFAQPFIENSLEHGLFKSQRENNVIIRFTAGEESIVLEVEDTGTGLIEKSESKGHKSLATQITQERLALFKKKFRRSFDLDIQNLKNAAGEASGLKVNLSLPTKVLV